MPHLWPSANNHGLIQNSRLVLALLDLERAGWGAEVSRGAGDKAKRSEGQEGEESRVIMVLAIARQLFCRPLARSRNSNESQSQRQQKRT